MRNEIIPGVTFCVCLIQPPVHEGTDGDCAVDFGVALYQLIHCPKRWEIEYVFVRLEGKEHIRAAREICAGLIYFFFVGVVFAQYGPRCGIDGRHRHAIDHRERPKNCEDEQKESLFD